MLELLICYSGSGAASISGISAHDSSELANLSSISNISAPPPSHSSSNSISRPTRSQTPTLTPTPTPLLSGPPGGSGGGGRTRPLGTVVSTGGYGGVKVLTLKVLVTTIDAQWEGMGDVGSARYEPALLPPCLTIRVLSYSN